MNTQVIYTYEQKIPMKIERPRDRVMKDNLIKKNFFVNLG